MVCKTTVKGVPQLPTGITSFSGAGLTGALPPSLGELGPSLTFLNLPRNAITSLPTELAALTGLQVLDLDSNRLAAVPTELGALTSLRTLRVSENLITAVPSELAALPELRFLGLADNRLMGVPAEFRTVDLGCSLGGNPGFGNGSGARFFVRDSGGRVPTGGWLRQPPLRGEWKQRRLQATPAPRTPMSAWFRGRGPAGPRRGAARRPRRPSGRRRW